MAAVAAELHPADLVAEAERLEEQAEQEMVHVRNLRAEAAKLRSRAERINKGQLVTVNTRRADRDDPLLAAAGLAVEDLRATWTTEDLAKMLAIRDHGRTARLVRSLRDLGVVEAASETGRWRSVDPQEARVRDGVIELDSFTRDELAEHLGVPPESLTWYLSQLRGKGIISGGDRERMQYEPTGSERVQTRRFRRPAPEREAVAKHLTEGRGRVVDGTGKPMIETGGTQRQAAERRGRGGKTRKRKK